MREAVLIGNAKPSRGLKIRRLLCGHRPRWRVFLVGSVQVNQCNTCDATWEYFQTKARR